MPQKISPFLEGKYGWNFGEGGWNSGMDENLTKFSFLFDKNIDAIVSNLPSNAVNGQAYFLTSDNRMYFRVEDSWYSSPTPKWFEFQIKNTGVVYRFDGTALSVVESTATLSEQLGQIEVVLSGLGSAAFEDSDHFATQANLDVFSAQANNYTDVLRSDLASPEGVNLVGGAASEEVLISSEGAFSVGYRRSVLATSIASVGEWLSAQAVNVWEYANLVTSKPSPNDPTTWDWTPAIQGAMDDLPDGGVLQYPAGGTFRHGKVMIPKTVHLVGYGCTLIPMGTEGGYEFAQEVIHDSPSFRGFRVIGDGETVLVGGFFRNFSGATIKGALFKDMYFSDLSFGIYINQLSSGYHQGAKIINCTFENMIDPSDGTISGRGLGVAFSGGNDAGRPPLLGLVHGCTFIRCGRHAAYIDSGSSVIFSNNHFIEHRFGKPLQSYPLAALNIGRARHVTAIGNEFIGSIDASLAVAGGAPMGDCRGVTVANNNFHNCYGTMNLRIGSDNPDDNGQVYGVNVTGNTFYHASDNAGAALYIDSAMGLHLRDNLFDASSLTVDNFGLIRVGAFGTTRPSGNYFIEGNTILMPTTGTARAISFNNNVLTGTARVDIGNNKIVAQAKWVLSVTVTNPNLNLTAYFANAVKSSASGAWNDNPLQIGNYRLWVTSTGKLMIKNGAPTSETDGTIVGTQL